MGKICFEDILSVIIKKETCSDKAATLIREILVLEQTLKNPEKQSFYFKKGIESRIGELKILKEQYNQIKALVNGNELEDLQEKISQRELKLQEWKDRVGSPMFIKYMMIASCESSINYLRSMMNIKNKYRTLKRIEEYSQEELIMFF
jgi:hypothetical protein